MSRTLGPDEGIVQHLPCPKNGVSNLTFSPDGGMLAGVSGKVLWCWTRNRNWEQSGIRHPGGFVGLAFHPNGRTLAYCTLPAHYPGPQSGEEIDYPGVRLYPLTAVSEFDVETLHFEERGNAADRFGFHWARGLVFTPDGRTLLSRIDEDRVFSRTQTYILHWHYSSSGDRWCVAKTVADRTLAEQGVALVGTDCLVLAAQFGIHICPLDPTAKAPLLTPNVSRLHPFATSPTGEVLAGWDNLRLHVWHLRQAKPIASWPIRNVSALTFSPDGETLAIGGLDRVVAFRNPLTGGLESAYEFAVGSVKSLAYAPEGLTLAVAGDRGLVVVDVG